MELLRVMEERRSHRAFVDKAVAKDVVAEVLRRAGRAPSALNLQPWELTVVMGEELNRLTRRLLRIHRERSAACKPGASRPLADHFRERRKASFDPLLQLLAQEGETVERFIGEGSCRFYGAPVAIIICIDEAFSQERYLCLGAFLGYLLLAAHDFGLGTCPVGLIAEYEDEIQEQLNIPEGKRVVLGVALGYPDKTSPLASFSTPRDPSDRYVRWFM